MLTPQKNNNKVGLSVTLLGDTEFRMDWTPAYSDWGEDIFRVCDAQGMRGLSEGETNFRKLRDSDDSPVMTPASSGEQERPRSRTPKGRARGWLEPPAEALPLPTTLGVSLRGAPSPDAFGVDVPTSLEGVSIYAAFVEQEYPWPRTSSGSMELVAEQLDAASETQTPEHVDSICDGGVTYPER